MRKTINFSSNRETEINPITAGYDVADIAVNQWNAQPNPPKVYIKGYRIHHGFVGLVMTGLGFVGLLAAGASKNKDTRDLVANLSSMAIGAGMRLMEDDITDMPDWFNFEKNSSSPQPILRENYLLPSQISPNKLALSYPYINPNEFA